MDLQAPTRRSLAIVAPIVAACLLVVFRLGVDPLNS